MNRCVWLTSLALLLGACFDVTPPGEMKCGEGHGCPAGYHCDNKNEKCVQDGADASTDGGLDAAGDTKADTSEDVMVDKALPDVALDATVDAAQPDAAKDSKVATPDMLLPDLNMLIPDTLVPDGPPPVTKDITLKAGRAAWDVAHVSGFLWIGHTNTAGKDYKITRVDTMRANVMIDSKTLLTHNGGRGITAGAGRIWLVDANKDDLLGLEPFNSWATATSFSLPTKEVHGVTFDGTGLWLADNLAQKIYNMSTAGVAGPSVAIPKGYHLPMEWDGTGIWTSTSKLKLVRYVAGGATDKEHTVTGLVPGAQINGATFGDGKIYISHGTNVVAVQPWSPTCAQVFSDSFVDATLGGWKKGSLVEHSTNSTAPKGVNGHYGYSPAPTHGGGHHRELPAAIEGVPFEIRARVRADAGSAGYAAFGVFRGNATGASSGKDLGHGYFCEWYPYQKRARVGLLKGSGTGALLAEAKNLSTKLADSSWHDLACRRLHDGTWSINLDGVPLELSTNIEDRTYTRLDHVSLFLDGGSTLFGLDDVKVFDCTALGPQCRTDSLGLTWCRAPAGKFTMGSPSTENCHGSGSKETQHEVTLTRGFEIARTETSQGPFKALLNTNPSKYNAGCGAACPVENVTWHEAAAFCSALSQHAGYQQCYSCPSTSSCTTDPKYTGQDLYNCPGFRLPTEAEWEYAYRAGTTTAYYAGPSTITSCSSCSTNPVADLIGWHCGNTSTSGHPPQKAGQKQSNPWGLHDMAGNVAEWVHDGHKDDLGSGAVTDPVVTGTTNGKVRGGASGAYPAHMRAAHRSGPAGMTTKDSNRGFRCVRTLNSVHDDGFEDFSRGTLSESGAKLYVSAKGNVQLLDRLDINRDGYLDLVFSNYADGSNQKTNSYVYSGNGFLSPAVELPTIGARDNTVADLDNDGWPDIVFANSNDTGAYSQNSFIYRGSASGFNPKKPEALSTVGATSSAVGDLNKDGHLDLVICNGGGSSPKQNTHIYWGSASGFSTGNRSDIPTIGAAVSPPADLNKDGYLDLVFGNYWDGKKHKINSYIYWGSASGYSAARRTELPTMGAALATVADLNGDGHLDIIYPNSFDGQYYELNSYIYWGSACGFSNTNKTELPTKSAGTPSVAFLNSDSYLDIVFPNSMDDKKNHKINSYIYMSDGKGGYPTSNRVEIPTLGATESIMVDLDNNGYRDLVFANANDGSTQQVNSYIYWGSTSAFSSTTKKAELPTKYAWGLPTPPGSVYDRKPIQTFTSRVFDTGVPSPTYSLLNWVAAVPKNTKLSVQVRSAPTRLELASATWYGPKTAGGHYVVPPDNVFNPKNGSGTFKLGTAHNGNRYIQYRAVFEHRFGNTPVLDRVEIHYK